MLAALSGQIERAARWAVWGGGAMLLLSAFMVTFDVLARHFYGKQLLYSDEISSYIFAISTTWAYSYCVLHRANVRIDALYLLFPRPVCAFLDIFALTLLTGFMGILTHRSWNVFTESLEVGAVSVTTLLTPLAIPQFLWVLGMIIFMFTLSLLLLRCLIALFQWNLAEIQAIAGVRSLDEEIKEEARIAEMGRQAAQGDN